MIQRFFLTTSSGALLAFLIVLACSHTSSAATFNSCLTASGAKTLTQQSTGYANAALAFNRRFSYKPAAIAYPKTPAQVASLVKCAAAANVPVVARSGGHSYAAYGLGGKDGSLVVDLSSMKAISVNQTTGHAVSQTGNRLGDLAQYIWDHGKRALPHGTCAYVGTGGHAAYGGFGLYGRTAGLLLDRVVSAQVVTANGSIVTASSSSHSDLFWAIRGAAPSYGIVTSYTFATLPAPSLVINYWYSFSQSLPNTEVVQIVRAYMNFAASKPTKQLQGVMHLYPTNGHVAVEISGTFYGSLADFNNAVAPLQSAFPANVGMGLRTAQRDWYNGMLDFMGSTSTSAPDDYDHFFVKSILADSAYSQSAITNWINYMTSQGASAPVLWWVLIDISGGLINTISPTATAYAHRSSVLKFQMYGYSSNDGHDPWVGQSGINFMNGLESALDPNPANAYPNYIDPTLTAAQWQSRYYGSNMARLKALKKTWDPANVFRFPQSIPLK